MMKIDQTVRTWVVALCAGLLPVASVSAQQDEDGELPIEEPVPDDAVEDEAEVEEAKPSKPVGALFDQLGAKTARDRIDAEQMLIEQLADDEKRDRIRDRAVELYQSSDDPEVWLRVREVLKSYVKDHSDFGPRRGFLGVLHGLTEYPDEKGKLRRAVRVEMAVPGAPAANAGVIGGDLVLMIDDVDLDTPHGDLSFFRYIFMQKGGKTVKLKILRDWKVIEVDAVLANRPVENFGQQLREQKSPDELFRDWLDEQKIEFR